MYSIYVTAGLGRPASGKELASTLLKRAARGVMAQLPNVGVELGIEAVDFPEIEGGWATVTPERGVEPTLIHQHVDSEIATLVFGQLDSAIDPAQVVTTEYRAGGTDSVQRLGGVFSAVVIERRCSRLVVFTSIPGCRSLRYVTQGRGFYLSSIDLGVVALSGMKIDIDMGAVAATVACGWSIGGRTALSGVRECSSLEHLRWIDGRLERRRHKLLCSSRLEQKDTQGVKRKIDEVIDELRAGVGQQLRHTDSQQLTIALTAGVDSRAALALVLPQREKATIETYTRGDPETRDVVVARRISERLGIGHRTMRHEPSLESAFLDNARLLAIATNGSGNSERALATAFRVASSAPALGGGGGEIFRGFYYNYLRRGRVRAGTAGVSNALLSFPLKRARNNSFANPALSSAAERHVHSAVSELADVSDNPYDMVDLFYLLERFGRWGSWSWRLSLGPMLVPFANTRAIVAAFQLPAPIGNHALVARVVERFAPRWLYWIPINGFELLATEGPGVAHYLTREVLRGSGKVVRRVRDRLARQHGGRVADTPQHTAAAYFAGQGYDAMHSLLLAPNSISRELMSRDQLERSLSAHRRALGELPTLGMLMNLEIWRQTLRDLTLWPADARST